MTTTRTPARVIDEIKEKRSYDVRYDTGETTERHGEQARVMVELSVHHDREDKQYVARLNVVEVGSLFVRHSSQIGGPREGKRPTSASLDRVTVPRFSAKGFREYAEAWQQAVENGTADTVSAAAADVLARLDPKPEPDPRPGVDDEAPAVQPTDSPDCDEAEQQEAEHPGMFDPVLPPANRVQRRFRKATGKVGARRARRLRRQGASAAA